MPLRKVTYCGRVFEELDIDAIKARKRDVVIIDELLHSNLPTSRNKKRYIDIEELLDEGISVYTLIFNILLVYLMKLHNLRKPM